MFSNNSTNSNMYRPSPNSYRGFHSNKRTSNVNPFNKERRFSNNSNVENKEQRENNTRFQRPYEGQNNNNRRNYSRPQQYKRHFYSSYERKEIKKKPTFELENNDFPSLSSGTESTPITSVNTNNDNNTLNFSKMLQSTPVTKEDAHPQPKKKFVSLVNLSKKKNRVKEEEFETDEEVEEMIEEQYNSMDEELEEYYNEERTKEDYFDYDY